MEYYKKKYKEALERAKTLHKLACENQYDNTRLAIEELFSELKESEDERIRKDIIQFFRDYYFDKLPAKIRLNTLELWSEWLEKQGEQKPELKKSEDERIRKSLIDFLDDIWHLGKDANFDKYSKADCAEWIAWVKKQGEHANFRNKIQIGDEVTRNEDGELVNLSQFKRMVKQGEQKPADKVEPKFKVGDWIVYCNEDVDLITCIEEKGYRINEGGYIPFVCEDDLRLWTIQDAKDGDVLYHKSPSGIEYIVMSSGVNEFGNVDSYFRYNSVDGFGIRVPSVFSTKIDNITPATKEQRDLLFQKMKEAGYEWDAEKKELRKIEQEEDVELTDFESALFSAFSDAWQEYLSGKEVNVAKWTKEHSAELLEVAREQKPAWSEEDEKGFGDALWAVQQARTIAKDENDMGNLWYAENWLKSLKERYTWKPSDEQLHYLSWIANIKLGNSVVEQEVSKHLNELLEDLKKLKKE